MPRVDVHMSSTIPPERIRKALIDFSPDRREDLARHHAFVV